MISNLHTTYITVHNTNSMSLIAGHSAHYHLLHVLIFEYASTHESVSPVCLSAVLQAGGSSAPQHSLSLVLSHPWPLSHSLHSSPATHENT